MPIFASLVAGLFGSLAGFLVKYVSQKVAVGAAAVAAFAALTLALWAALGAAMNAISVAAPNTPGWATGVWLALPPNAPACIAAAIAADAAIALYRWNRDNVKLMTGA